MTSRSQIRIGVVSIFVAVALVVGWIIGSLASVKAGNNVPLLVAGSTNSAINQVSFAEGFSPVIKRVLPAVVNVASSKVVRTEGGEPFTMDPFFQQFFGHDFFRHLPQQQREHSLGSGVVVNPDGYVLTNYHVVEKASEIKIFRDERREFTAKVVGTDPKTDLAVLKVNEKDLPVITFGDSSKVQVGEFALAIGNPLGVGQTVTMGIISATGRGGLGIEDYEDFIQTDASINPGNSGGALINSRGELIGINTAILSRSGGNQGIGFAIPVNMARNVMEQILKNGKVVRGWLGVVIQPVTTDIARAFGLSGEPRGALVGDVQSSSPAAKAGIEKGDIILDLNGEAVADSRALQLRVGTLAPGAVAHLKVFRKGSEHDIALTLGEAPANPANESSQSGGGASGALEGLSVDNLTPGLLRQLGLPAGTTGVVVTDVQSGSAAAESGLQRGDVIEEVNRAAVSNTGELSRALQKAGSGTVLLLINRGGNTLYLAVAGK